MPDPPRHAATAPDVADPDRPVHAVGIGPGAPSYLTGAARGILANADVVIGLESVLDRIRAVTDADQLRCDYDNQEALLEAFAARVAEGEQGVAALMGDPNVSGYTFLGRVELTIDRPVRVIPGVSSIQVAASRARTPIEESTIVTLHKRGDLTADFDSLIRDAGSRHLLVLPRPFDRMPDEVAARLLERGVDESLDALVCERLTLEDESIERFTLGDLAAAQTSFSDLSVLVVRKP